MRLRSRHSPFLLLAVASLAGALASENADPRGDSPAFEDALRNPPTKNAPVDGKDGVPHSGPFVSTEADSDADQPERPVLKSRPDDMPVTDEKRAPEPNDGVMLDKNREHPQEGTTGLEGGVSEKERDRKAQEDFTGEKAVTQPEAPAVRPPLPHSEEEKIREKGTTGANDEEDEVPDLPEPAADSAYEVIDTDGDDADGQDTYTPPKTPESGTTSLDGHEGEEEGLIQPFHSFVLSFTMIMFSEIGDKTFLVAALMAMKHDRMVVFTAAFSALVVMTIFSATLGQVVPNLISKRLTSFAAAILFVVFGAKLLREGMQMDPNEGVTAEMHEVEQELAEKEKELGRHGAAASPHALEMGINGRASRSKGRFASPPRSPSQSPDRDHRTQVKDSLSSAFQGAGNLFSLLLSPAWVQTFVMTFLGEWGDRSQIATIAMAAGDDYWLVTLGALVGHTICTGIAVLGGRAIAGRVSLKVVTVGGAVAFLVFGLIYLLEALYG